MRPCVSVCLQKKKSVCKNKKAKQAAAELKGTPKLEYFFKKNE